jgi:hypothetical protein
MPQFTFAVRWRETLLHWAERSIEAESLAAAKAEYLRQREDGCDWDDTCADILDETDDSVWVDGVLWLDDGEEVTDAPVS